MTDKQKQELEDEKNKNNPNYNPEMLISNTRNKKNKKKQNWKDKEITELDYSRCDFPVPYSEARLVENWFEFNDATVKPIYPGQLQSKFGGKQQNGCAYMLVYRQKSLNPKVSNDDSHQVVDKPKMPNYLKEVIDTTNATYSKDRETYEQMKNQIDIVLQDKEQYFMVTQNEVIGEAMPLIKYRNSHDFEMKGVHCRLSLDDTLDDAFAKILESTALPDDFELFEVCQEQQPNKYCRVLRCFSDLRHIKRRVDGREIKNDNEPLSIRELNHLEPDSLSNHSTWLVIPNSQTDPQNTALCSSLKNFSGQHVLPIRLRIKVFGDETELLVYNSMSAYLLLKKLEDMTSFAPETMKVIAVSGVGSNRREIRIDNRARTPEALMTVSLLELDLNDGTEIQVDLKDEEEIAREQQEAQQQEDALKDDQGAGGGPGGSTEDRAGRRIKYAQDKDVDS